MRVFNLKITRNIQIKKLMGAHMAPFRGVFHWNIFQREVVTSESETGGAYTQHLHICMHSSSLTAVLHTAFDYNNTSIRQLRLAGCVTARSNMAARPVR